GRIRGRRGGAVRDEDNPCPPPNDGVVPLSDVKTSSVNASRSVARNEKAGRWARPSRDCEGLSLIAADDCEGNCREGEAESEEAGERQGGDVAAGGDGDTGDGRADLRLVRAVAV